MNKCNVRLNFFWDDGDDMDMFTVTFHEDKTEEDVKEAILEAHDYLDNNDSTDYYGINGRNPASLLSYVCQKHGWRYSQLQFGVDLNIE